LLDANAGGVAIVAATANTNATAAKRSSNCYNLFIVYILRSIIHVCLRFLPYEKAREFVHKQGLKNQKEWKDFSKSDKKPDYIPAAPHKVYRGKGWTNLGDWLGTGILAPKDREYWPFERAKKFAQSSGIKNAKEWFSASKTIHSNIYSFKIYCKYHDMDNKRTCKSLGLQMTECFK
jgi:hypothetical protein